MSSHSDWRKAGLRKPTGPEHDEHSAVADLATGRRFKAVQDVPNTTIIDEVSDTVTYIGESIPGASTSAALWRIKKMVVDGTVTHFMFADGDDLFDNTWSDRASLSYS